MTQTTKQQEAKLLDWCWDITKASGINIYVYYTMYI